MTPWNGQMSVPERLVLSLECRGHSVTLKLWEMGVDVRRMLLHCHALCCQDDLEEEVLGR